MHIHRVLVLVAVLASAIAVPPLRADEASAKSSPEQRKTQAKLAVVRARIKRLTEQQQQADAQRNQLSNQLAQQARALREAANAVRDTEQQLKALNDSLAQLQQQQQQIQDRLDKQHDALAALLRATYMLGHGSDLRMLMGQVSDCAQPA